MPEFTQLNLRPALPTDAAFIRGMVMHARINPFGLDWRRFMVAAGPQGEMLGCVQIKPHRDCTRELASLVVAPAWRGRGIARCLIERMQEVAPPPLYLTCRSNLQPLYRKFGFRTLSTNEMTPYFLRLYRFVNFIRIFLRTRETLAVMIWEKW